MIFPGPYLCMMCGEEPQGEKMAWGWFPAPFEVDSGHAGTTPDEAWIYCKSCDCWTAFAPIPDDLPPAIVATPRQELAKADPSLE